jgi:hypothetical protein
MKWYSLEETYEMEDFLDEEHEFVDLKSVEVIFEDGEVTGLLVELRDKTLVEITSRAVKSSGRRERLYVSTMEGND